MKGSSTSISWDFRSNVGRFLKKMTLYIYFMSENFKGELYNIFCNECFMNHWKLNIIKIDNLFISIL